MAELTQPPATSVTEAKGNGRVLRILLADDSKDNLLLVLNFLKRTPHRVDTVGDGREAVTRFAERRYDLVLMDMQMPRLDGYGATREIRALEAAEGRPRTPIIALTAHALDEHQEHSLAAGCDAHLTKPISRRALLEAVERFR